MKRRSYLAAGTAMSALALLFLLLPPASVYSQRFELGFGNSTDGAVDVDQVDNSALSPMLSGTISIGTRLNQYYRPYLVKTDRVGTILWSQLYEDAANYFIAEDHSVAVMQATDGSEDIIWASAPPRPFAQPTETDIYVCRLDKNGNFMWGKIIGGVNQVDYPTALAMTATGDIVVTGYNSPNPLPNPGPPRIFVAKLSGTGTVIFQGAWSSSEGSMLASGVLTSGNSIVISAVFSDNSGVDANDMFLLSISSNGQLLNFAKRYGGTGHQLASDLAFDPNSNIVVVGSAASPTNTTWDAHAIKVDPFGNLLLGKRYYHQDLGSQSSNELVNALTPNLGDNGFILTGEATPDISVISPAPEAFAFGIDLNLNINSGPVIYSPSPEAGIAWDIVRSNLGDPNLQGYYIAGGKTWPVSTNYLLRVDFSLSSGCDDAYPMQTENLTVAKNVNVSRLELGREESKQFNHSEHDPSGYVCALQTPKQGADSRESDIATSDLRPGIRPNPVASGTEFQLVLTMEQAAALQIHISDMTGRRLQTFRRTAVQGANRFAIETRGLRPGMYLVDVRAPFSQQRFRLVVNE